MQLIESEAAVINPVIRIELLQGAKDFSHQRQLIRLLSPVEVLPLSDAVWEEVPRFALRSREKGVTLTTVDAIIAAHAALIGASLWSLDAVFQRLSGVKLITA